MKNLSDLVGKEIIIKRTGGEAGLNSKQKANLNGLGLRGRESKSCLMADSAVIGMLRKVLHLVEVEIK